MTPSDTTDDALEQSITIDAPPERVWELVHDVRRIPEWSPDVESTRFRDGFDGPALGAEFTSRNSKRGIDWITHGEIVRYDEPSAIAFRIAENHVIWSFTLEPDGDGTRVVQRRDAPDGISELSKRWADEHFGGEDAFSDPMLDGMAQTLQRLKAAVEG